MKTYLECIPCFMKQTLQAGRLMHLDDASIKALLDTVGAGIQEISLDASPPDMARRLQKLINERIGDTDPYHELKQESNTKALEYYQSMHDHVQQSADRLKTALQVAIAGNIIDYGAIHDLDISHELKTLLDEELLQLEQQESPNFCYEQFREDLSRAGNLLYVGDNAGEIVFDKILISTIRELYPDLRITFATRGRPILNDCLVEDALQIGIDELAEVVSSGSDAPGMIIDRCSEEFMELFRAADLVISKGQGNFEALSHVKAPIYFLLIAKCPVVARELGCELRDIILRRSNVQP